MCEQLAIALETISGIMLMLVILALCYIAFRGK